MIKPTYKILFMDIDGTIAKSDFVMSPKVVSAIKDIKQKLRVVLITGRTYKVAQWYINELGLESDQVVEAGARIVTYEGKTVWAKYLEPRIIPHLVTLFRKNKAPYSVCRLSDSTHFSADSSDKFPTSQITRISGLHLLESQADQLQNELTVIPEIFCTKAKSVTEPNTFNVDITHHLANKKFAVREYFQLHGYQTEESIGIGDSYNDLPFIEEMGYKMAMGNAILELKTIADYVAPSIENDGSAVAIEHLQQSGLVP